MSEGNGGEPVVYRFADPSVTETFSIPGCFCPAGIHKSETITYRTQLGAGEWEIAKSVGLAEGVGEFINFGASNTQSIVMSVTEWTLLTNEPCFHPRKPHGKHEPLGISRYTVALLHDKLRQALLERIQKAAADFSPTMADDAEPSEPESLPNGSGARSRASSRASASPTPTTPPPA